MLRQENGSQSGFANLHLLRTQAAPGDYGEVAQRSCRKNSERFILLSWNFGGGSEHHHSWSSFNSDFVIRNFIKYDVAYARLDFAQPFAAFVDRQHRVERAQHHHATTAKIQISRPPRFALASQGRANLLHHMRGQSCFFRINLGNVSLKADRNLR
jgi:hypothetical protein